jgi:hypothetical protein
MGGFADQRDEVIGVDPESAGLSDQWLHEAFGEPSLPPGGNGGVGDAGQFDRTQ